MYLVLLWVDSYLQIFRNPEVSVAHALVLRGWVVDNSVLRLIVSRLRPMDPRGGVCLQKKLIPMSRWWCKDTDAKILTDVKNDDSKTTDGKIQMPGYWWQDIDVIILMSRYCCQDSVVKILMSGYWRQETVVKIMMSRYCCQETVVKILMSTDDAKILM